MNVSFSVLAHSIHEEPPKQLIWTPYTAVINWCLTLLDLDLNINNADRIDLDLCSHVTFAISTLKKKKERKFTWIFPFMKNHTIQSYLNTWKKMNVMHNSQSYCSSVLLLDLDLNNTYICVCLFPFSISELGKKSVVTYCLRPIHEEASKLLIWTSYTYFINWRLTVLILDLDLSNTQIFVCVLSSSISIPDEISQWLLTLRNLHFSHHKNELFSFLKHKWWLKHCKCACGDYQGKDSFQGGLGNYLFMTHYHLRPCRG